jgi:succinate dehydrogenase/fumarate reductase flavoprotein subunit
VEDSRESALSYLRNEVGNRLDRELAEAFLEHGPRMLDFLEAHSHLSYALAAPWPDYHPEVADAMPGGRSLWVDHFDGRRLGKAFANLRRPLETTMIMGGMSIAREDVPHFLRMTRSFASAVHVGRLFLRHLVDRIGHARGTRIANGNALVARLVLTLEERGVPMFLSSPATRLLQEEGRVSGAVLDRGGKPVEVHATRGVVLASGGFPASEDMKERYYPHLRAGKNHHSLPPQGNNGDGIRLGREAGGAFSPDAGKPAAWTPVSVVPRAKGQGEPFPHFIDRGKPGVIAVDRRGARFVNEANSYHDFVLAMFEACRDEPRIEIFLVADHRAIRRYGLGAVPPSPGRIGPHLRSGYLLRGEDIEGLAAESGIDPGGLRATVERFNRTAEHGEDPEFGKGGNVYNRFNGDPAHRPNPCLEPLRTPPYYAVRVIPGDLGTFMGMKTDAFARVLDETQAPIPGLYAAGNDMASFMGGNYPGAGITIGPAMTFGYIAANHMAGVEPGAG